MDGGATACEPLDRDKTGGRSGGVQGYVNGLYTSTGKWFNIICKGTSIRVRVRLGLGLGYKGTSARVYCKRSMLFMYG